MVQGSGEFHWAFKKFKDAGGFIGPTEGAENAVEDGEGHFVARESWGCHGVHPAFLCGVVTTPPG